MWKWIQKRRAYFIVIMILGVVAIWSNIGIAVLGEPGSEGDPLITLSYVEKRINQIKYYIDEKISDIAITIGDNDDKIIEIEEKVNNINKELQNTSLQSENRTSSLEIVELKDGQKLICKSGTEIILRGGNAFAIASELGGLADVTGAVDLKMDKDIPANHLLIVPRDDGRGVYAPEYAIFMVRGKYTIE